MTMTAELFFKELEDKLIIVSSLVQSQMRVDIAELEVVARKMCSPVEKDYNQGKIFLAASAILLTALDNMNKVEDELEDTENEPVAVKNDSKELN